MPNRTKDIKLTTLNIPETISISLDNHFIQAITLTDLDGVGSPVEFYGQFGIMSGDLTIQNITTCLGSGYFGAENPLFWSGKYLALTDTRVYARISGPATWSVRLSVSLYKIEAREDNTVRVDP